MAKRGSSSSGSGAASIDASRRIVVLHGKDAYLMREHTRRLVEALEKEFGSIEQFQFDGLGVQPATILDELRSYGLIQRHKLVILDQADQFLAGKKGADADDDGDSGVVRPLMEKYARSPVPEATLLMRAETWRKGRLDKILAEGGGVVVACEAPSEGEAITWCQGRCKKRYECEIAPEAAELLVQRLGPDLARLDLELQKLAASINYKGTITPQHVGPMVELSRQEQAWEIQNAMLTGRPEAAIGKLIELIEVSRVEAVPLTWSVIDLLRKMHAASQMIRQGMPEGAISGSLRLWGPSGFALLRVARQVEPDRLAALFDQAIRTDRRVKSGGGEPRRSLEGLTVLVADTMAG